MNLHLGIKSPFFVWYMRSSHHRCYEARDDHKQEAPHSKESAKRATTGERSNASPPNLKDGIALEV
jgi:hypothetical protein